MRPKPHPRFGPVLEPFQETAFGTSLFRNMLTAVVTDNKRILSPHFFEAVPGHTLFSFLDQVTW
jgi:hypothetical protein